MPLVPSGGGALALATPRGALFLQRTAGVGGWE